MIKHLKPFSQEYIANIRKNLTPVEKLEDDIRGYIEEKCIFQFNNKKTRNKIISDLRKIIKNQFILKDITTPKDTYDGYCIFSAYEPKSRHVISISIQGDTVQ
jgi:hypothetical protein